MTPVRAVSTLKAVLLSRQKDHVLMLRQKMRVKELN